MVSAYAGQAVLVRFDYITDASTHGEGWLIDDLSLGDGRIRPGGEEATRACREASAGPLAEGSIGASRLGARSKQMRTSAHEASPTADASVRNASWPVSASTVCGWSVPTAWGW